MPVIAYKNWTSPTLQWRLKALALELGQRKPQLEEARLAYFRELQHTEAIRHEMEEISSIMDERLKTAHALQGLTRHCHTAGRKEWEKRTLPAPKASKSSKATTTPEQQLEKLLKNMTPEELLAILQKGIK